MKSRLAPARLVVLASGNGTNLQVVIDACEDGQLDARVVGVGSDLAEAFALQRAAKHGIACATITSQQHEPRRDYDARLLAAVALWQPDLVILAGFMRVLSVMFLAQFCDRVINLHPALPGQLPGINAIARAFSEFNAGTRTSTGVMVHYVPDEGVDSGPVIATETVIIDRSDTLADLESRMHAAERRVLIRAINTFITTQQKEAAS